MKKLTIILALLISNVANAATYASGVVPIYNNYNFEIDSKCSVDASYASALPALTTQNLTSIGYVNFTPDSTHTSTVSSADAYSKFITYISGLTTYTPKITAPVLSQVTDPTNTTLKLIETPIQWGLMKQTTMASDATGPYTSIPAPYNYNETGFLIITKFTYANSALNNGFTTGYAAYYWNNGNTKWGVFNAFPNTFSATSSSTNILFLGTDHDQINVGSQGYPTNCTTKARMTR